MRKVEVFIEINTDKDASVATGEMYVLPETPSDYPQRVIATASSKRNPIDKFDPEVGENLAAGRVLVKLGKKLIKQGDGAVKHVDDMKLQSEQAKKRPKLKKILGKKVKAR